MHERWATCVGNLALNRAVTVWDDVGNWGMPFQINHMLFIATGGVRHSPPLKHHFDVHRRHMKIVGKWGLENNGKDRMLEWDNTSELHCVKVWKTEAWHHVYVWLALCRRAVGLFVKLSLKFSRLYKLLHTSAYITFTATIFLFSYITGHPISSNTRIFIFRLPKWIHYFVSQCFLNYKGSYIFINAVKI